MLENDKEQAEDFIAESEEEVLARQDRNDQLEQRNAELEGRIVQLQEANERLKEDVETLVAERPEAGLIVNGPPIVPLELIVLVAECLASSSSFGTLASVTSMGKMVRKELSSVLYETGDFGENAERLLEEGSATFEDLFRSREEDQMSKGASIATAAVFDRCICCFSDTPSFPHIAVVTSCSLKDSFRTLSP
ncbi:hypothetical protein QFC24_005838 [Naganishia onofrii]|uniref:Uncharacterized protein n=1 Tax=Naganishia onofrii TaxID=1851511 RepID=A0ACC2X7X8_9TREE|nr:hypothetical protein QFC24_005838 [Naganishia onofrii]